MSICVMGPAKAGKSALIKKWTQSFFDDRKRYDPTMGDTYSKEVERDGVSSKVSIRDTAGIYHFAAMRESDIKGGTVFLVGFGVDNIFQFQEVPEFIAAIRKVRGNPPIALIGLKADLHKERGVTVQKAEEFAKANAMPYFECSAKNNTNVDAVFRWALQYVPMK